MEFHLERKLQLLTTPKHKSLYSWAINEVDDHGKVVGDDQIPWSGFLCFTATEIVLTDEITVKAAFEMEGFEPHQAKSANRRKIWAKLRPGRGIDSDDPWRQIKYRMFGTDRVINDFQLSIRPLETEDETETCSAWGGVSYTQEASETGDFKRETTDDCVIFSLMVKPSTFDRYAARISDNTADEMILIVTLAAGFYSEWTPSIFTEDVKVLTDGDEHELRLPADFKFEPPRLGRVMEAELRINARRVQARNVAERRTDEGVDSELDDELRSEIDEYIEKLC
jgi:hypothetical protein